MAAYYNEIDPFAADWLRELIKAGLIAPGEVDERSIEDVVPTDLAGFVQCHFFAGIGVWSYTLRRAGWPDSQPVWTGSCPCQSFSTAGKQRGADDPRHLWPVWFRLIEACTPPVIFGEQVANSNTIGPVVKKSGRKPEEGDRPVWFDSLQADLERASYATGACDTPAAGFGAPHIRQRLYWVAERGVENPFSQGLERHSRDDQQEKGWALEGRFTPETSNASSELDNGGRPGPTNGFWEDVDWLFCRDGKWRAVESSAFPLAHGATNRVGRLRGYGNAINAAQAEAFIRAYMEVADGR